MEEVIGAVGWAEFVPQLHSPLEQGVLPVTFDGTQQVDFSFAEQCGQLALASSSADCLQQQLHPLPEDFAAQQLDAPAPHGLEFAQQQDGG